MKIVFVHGRSQAHKDPVVLKKMWVDTLRIGFAKSGLEWTWEDDDIIFPFYGDKLDELVRQINQPIDAIIKGGGPIPITDAVFFHDFLMEIAQNAEIGIPEIQAGIPENIVEKGPLNWKWVHGILRAIDKKSGWGELALKKVTYDVFLYLTIGGIRTAIDNIVLQSIPAEPCIVVGHSMGTIVTYNILRDNKDLQVTKYITVGSPLGLYAVKKWLRTPIAMPTCVEGGWFNAFDRRDVVALNPLNNTYFDIDPAVENRNDVDNQTNNRHGIEGYLNDKEVAKQIHAALTGKG